MATKKTTAKKPRAKRAASTKPNKGFEKIKKINKLAHEIREHAGFHTETIKVKKYKINLMSTAVKMAAASLKRKKVEKQGTLRFKK